MNREILSRTIIEETGNYANDELQAICRKIAPYDSSFIMEHIDSIRTLEKDRPEEYKGLMEQCRLQSFNIKIFNSIVSQGQEFALKFIKTNLSLL